MFKSILHFCIFRALVCQVFFFFFFSFFILCWAMFVHSVTLWVLGFCSTVSQQLCSSLALNRTGHLFCPVCAHMIWQNIIFCLNCTSGPCDCRSQICPSFLKANRSVLFNCKEKKVFFRGTCGQNVHIYIWNLYKKMTAFFIWSYRKVLSLMWNFKLKICIICS